MADKVEKPKKAKAKPKKDEKGVLAALPSTRPERIGTRRTATAPKKPAAAKTSPRAAKTSPAATTARAKPSSRPTAARRKAAAPRTFEPTGAAEAAAGAADPASLRSSPRPAGAGARAAGVTTEPQPQPRPRAVREGAPGIGTTSPDRTEAEAAETGRPSGVELVTTAVQAAGELTQIGLTIGGRIVKRAVDRLPKP